MIYYNFKPIFISKRMLRIKKGLDAYEEASLKAKYFLEKVASTKLTKEMSEHGRKIMKRRADLYGYKDPETIFTLYTNNSYIPYYLVGRVIRLYMGYDFQEFKIRFPWMVGWRFGHFIKNKICGKRIHVNNKIAKKKIKKLKQLMALVEQRMARRRKQKVHTNKTKGRRGRGRKAGR